MYEDMTKPPVIGTVTDELFERLLDQLPAGELTTLGADRFSTSVPYDAELMDALDEFKDMSITYAEESRQRPVKATRFIIDSTVAAPGEQQRKGTWHAETGLVILASSAFPTEIAVGTDNATPESTIQKYIRRTNFPSRLVVASYSDYAIQQGVSDGVLAIHQPLPGQAIELGPRIHRGAFNPASEMARKVFLTCEIEFKRQSIFDKLRK